MRSYDNKLRTIAMRKLKELIMRIRALFGIIHPTNPFIVDLIQMCRFAEHVQVHYFGGPKQMIQIALQTDTFDWTIFLGQYKHLVKIVHGETINYNPSEVTISDVKSAVCFHISILDLNFHDVNVLANFSQTDWVNDTNIKLGVEPVRFDPDKSFQSIGDGYFTLA